jgi:hypothetical protein
MLKVQNDLSVLRIFPSEVAMQTVPASLESGLPQSPEIKSGIRVNLHRQLRRLCSALDDIRL